MTDNNTIIKETTLTDLFNELNISKSNNYNLILWNDHINSMQHIVFSLFEVCQLSAEESLKIMFEAHSKGKAVAKTGTEDEMLKFKRSLNDKNIEATVEKE